MMNQLLNDTIWALDRGSFRALMRSPLGHVSAYQPQQPARRGAVAVIPLRGLLMPRYDYLCALLGGTPLDRWTALFRQAYSLADTVVIDVDSGGGMVQATDELSAEIFRARQGKRIIAAIQPFCASAAYWIASAASEITIQPTGQVGSIGIYVAHTDYSEQDKMLGLKTTLISAGRFKIEANEYFPLDVEARAHLQAMADYYYDMFITTVARNRGVTTTRVKYGMGEGRTLLARDALRAGMVDKIATLDQVLGRVP